MGAGTPTRHGSSHVGALSPTQWRCACETLHSTHALRHSRSPWHSTARTADRPKAYLTALPRRAAQLALLPALGGARGRQLTQRVHGEHVLNLLSLTRGSTAADLIPAAERLAKAKELARVKGGGLDALGGAGTPPHTGRTKPAVPVPVL